MAKELKRAVKAVVWWGATRWWARALPVERCTGDQPCRIVPEAVYKRLLAAAKKRGAKR
jgi:hypothetical protein